jgi:hypothetical protein
LYALPGDDEVEEELVPRLFDQSCMNMHCLDSGALCAVLIAAEGNEASSLATFEQVLEARNDNLFRFGTTVHSRLVSE